MPASKYVSFSLVFALMGKNKGKFFLSQWLGHSNLETTLVYAYADTEQKRRAIEKSMGCDVIAGVDLPKYSVSDEEILKKLYGLK